jgi:cation diffusion facilitator family transporter
VFEGILNHKKRAMVLSLTVSIAVMALKFLAYLYTHSNAILTDAAESIVNIAASSFALYSLYLVSVPKDKNHLYGHGKIEFFSSGVEGLLIIIAGVGTLIPAIFQLFSPSHTLHNFEIGIILNIVIILINGLLGTLVYKTGQKQNSIILMADGKHLLIDSLSSLVSMTALVLVWWTGKAVFDPIIALFLAFYIIYNGYKILRNSVGGLMDETDQDLLDQVINILKNERRKEWIDVHNLKIMRYGTDVHIDCHLTLPYYFTLEKSHEEVSLFEKRVSEKYGEKIDFFIHSDPCLADCCSYCQIADCQVRKSNFSKVKEWSVERLILNHKHFVD